jgi:hypothetical protein
MMQNIIPILIIILSLSSCSPNGTYYKENEQQPVDTLQYTEIPKSKTFLSGKKQLEAQGYKDVEYAQLDYFCLTDEDSYLLSEGFTAKTATNETVSGCFCVKGLIHNSITIRFK